MKAHSFVQEYIRALKVKLAPFWPDNKPTLPIEYSIIVYSCKICDGRFLHSLATNSTTCSIEYLLHSFPPDCQSLNHIINHKNILSAKVLVPTEHLYCSSSEMLWNKTKNWVIIKQKSNIYISSSLGEANHVFLLVILSSTTRRHREPYENVHISADLISSILNFNEIRLRLLTMRLHTAAQNPLL